MTLKNFFAALSLLLSQLVYSQPSDIVAHEGIVRPLHKAHIGEITFFSKPIPLDQYTEADFLRSFELTDTSDLAIRVFLGNSLTNYLHRLDTSLSVDDLNKKGNYQFSFYINGAKVYTENVHTGAGTLESKKTRTIFRIPLASYSQEESWGRYMWARFMMRAGEDLLTVGKHQLKIEIRPYLQTTELKTGALIASGEIELLIRKAPFTPEQIAVQPIAAKSGWKEYTGRFDSTIIRKLNQKIIQRDFKDITSIVVIHEGQLALEEYFNKAGRDSLHDTRSVGKTFTSALLGLAIRDGHIKNEEEPLSHFYNLQQYAHYSPAKTKIRLKDLLTMSSPFAGSDDDPDSPGNEEKMYPTADWVKFALDLPLDSSKLKNQRWDYFTAGVVVLGDVLHRKVPGGLERYAMKQLFSPLGVRQLQWQYTPQGVANTAGGLALRSIDLARFGELYRCKGAYDGKQLIPKDWVEKSLANHFSLQGSEQDHYGYLFWKGQFQVRDKDIHTAYLSGNGGNKVFIFQEVRLVIVITSTAYNKPYGHRQAQKIVEQYLLPAFTQ